MPPSHLVLTEYLLEFLASVASHLEDNLMTSRNLARILSPNVLRPKTDNPSIEEFEQCSIVLEMLIDNQKYLSLIKDENGPFKILESI